jgi:imidazolonepropionase
MSNTPASAIHEQWTLIRGASQLLTLRGASGPRRGFAMSDLNVIPDGAVLVRGAVIEEVGTSRRIENLATARSAREIDVTGKVVMPSFADPDIALVAPAPPRRSDGSAEEADVRRMSRRRVEAEATSVASDLVRYGVLTAGAHSLFAPDLQSAVKVLRAHSALQGKPLRVRSIYSVPSAPGGEDGSRHERICVKWLPSIARKHLSSLVEIAASTKGIEKSRSLAVAAAAAGQNIRLRVSGRTTGEVLELAYSAGAISLVGPIPSPGTMLSSVAVYRALADIGCVYIIQTARVLSGDYISKRNAIDDGVPVALASGHGNGGLASINPQFLLHMACKYLGLTVEEAIVAATYNSLCSLRLSHVSGSLEPGKAADLCVMDVGDYHELARRVGHHDTYLVMRAGKIVYRRPHITLE